jgi:hypothetical protein
MPTIRPRCRGAWACASSRASTNSCAHPSNARTRARTGSRLMRTGVSDDEQQAEPHYRAFSASPIGRSRAGLGSIRARPSLRWLNSPAER